MSTLGWSADKQKELESLATLHLQSREAAGKQFGLITHIYEYMHDQLPGLSDEVLWTPTLLAELLSRGGSYRVIGTQRNAFTSISNTHDIQTLDDLLSHILKTEYDGAANLAEFAEDMRKAGILQKSLAPSMLGAGSRVVIDRYVVRLAELQDSVT